MDLPFALEGFFFEEVNGSTAVHLWIFSGDLARPLTFYECKAIAYCFNLFSDIGIYIIVFMTIDRFIAVRFPFKMSQVCTPRRARISIASICIGAMLYTAPYLYTSGLVDGTMCSSIKDKTLFAQTFSWVNVFVTSVVPFCSLLTMNTMIVKTVFGRNKCIKSEMSKKEKTSSNTDKERSVKCTKTQGTDNGIYSEESGNNQKDKHSKNEDNNTISEHIETPNECSNETKNSNGKIYRKIRERHK